MIYSELAARLLGEDISLGDVTTEALGIGDRQGIMEFRARFDCVLGGVAEAAAVLKALAMQPEILLRSGAETVAGTLFMSATGSAAQLHAGWKIAQNIMEHATGIATRTRLMVKRGRAVNPDLVVACTRKSFPGGKTICMNAIAAGDGVPHRLGLSETFLMFENHSSFFRGKQEALEALRAAAKRLPEKKLAVEVGSLEYALEAAAAGAGIIQFDKVKPPELSEWVPKIRARFPHLIIDAAGGINADSIAEYAATGIDVAVTSAVYNGKPMDIEVVIKPVDGKDDLWNKANRFFDEKSTQRKMRD